LACVSDTPEDSASGTDGATGDALASGDAASDVGTTTDTGTPGEGGGDGSTGDGGAPKDAGATWDGNFGAAPPSSATFKWNRILSDGTDVSYFVTGVAGTFFGDVIVAARLVDTTSSLGTPALLGPGFLVARIGPDNQTVRWRQTFAGSANVPISTVLVDEFDDVYITGNVRAGQSLGLGGSTILGNHGFVAKLRGSDGQLLWAQEVVGSTASTAHLTTKPGKPLVLSGVFTGILSYPAASNGNLSKTGDGTRGSGFVMPLDRGTGKASWARTFLSSQSTFPAIDADMRTDGNVEVALGIAGTVTTDKGAFVTLPDVSVILATLDGANGNDSNVVHYLTTYMFDVGVRALPGGGVVAAGEKALSSDIMGSVNTSSSQDMWILGMNAAHGQLWAKWITGQYPAQSDDRREFLSCIDVDHWGRILVGLNSASDGLVLNGTVIPGARTAAGTSTFLALIKLTEAGDPIWSKGVNAGTSFDVYPTSCQFGLNGDTLFAAEAPPNATPDFGGSAVLANPHESSAIVKWSP
jgi:hypothetical protein